MDPSFEFWNRVAGHGPVVIIAEAGVNHDGSVSDAHRLIDAAATSGADAVKFQTFSAEDLVATSAPSAAYQSTNTGMISQFEMLSSLVLPESCWPELSEHAQSLGLEFISTPFDLQSAQLLLSLGMRIVKVPSGELTNAPFLRDLANLGRPMLISTGMSNLEEVRFACATASSAPAIALMHCVSSYPTPDSACNLLSLSTLRENFAVPVGWSDHTLDNESAVIAVTLGATVVEKHLTLDRSRRGPDHIASLEPEMFKTYVSAIRRTELMLGSGIKQAQPIEEDVRRVARRSWHSAKELSAGHRLTGDDIVALRPATGISPSINLEGRRLRRSVAAGEVLTESDIDV